MTIVQRIGEASVYEQLAEECTELAQAAIKMSRLIRGVNLPAKSRTEIEKELAEEISDIEVCLYCLGLEPDEDLMDFKLKRWCRRLNGGADAGEGVFE